MNVKKNKKWWQYLLIIPVQVLISVGILWLVGSREISAFYNDPSHVGFAIPVVSIILGIILLIVTFVVAVIALILALKSKKE